jgi:hypothetical protein
MNKREFKREILELFCGFGGGQIDCITETEFKLDNIITEFQKDKECEMCGWGEHKNCIRCGKEN